MESLNLYESHITLADANFKSDEFKNICKELSVKPLVIEDHGNPSLQFMSAKFHKTKSFVEAMDETQAIANRFAEESFLVQRVKLELILSKTTQLPDKYYYLEYHSKYIVPNCYLEEFIHLVNTEGGHTSKNLFKEAKPGLSYRFMTTRNETLHNHIKEKLKPFFELVNTIRECVVYDSNPSLDKHIKCFDCPLKEFI